MKKTITICAILALAVPLLGFARPVPAERAVTGSAEAAEVGPTAAERAPAYQQVVPVPCRCKPSVLLFGPLGCKCPFDLLLSALKRGQCTPANAVPPCKPVTPCTVSIRLFWVGEEDGCDKPPKPQFAPMKAVCGSFAMQIFFCPVGPGLVTVFLPCEKCKP